jgi:hypothetical protein
MTPFRLELAPSRLWLGGVVLMHFFLLFAVLRYLSQHWWLLLPMPWSLLHCLRAGGWLSSRSRPSVLAVGARGELTLSLGGKPCAARLLPDSTVWSWLTVLRLESEGKRYSMMVLPDAALAEARRRLNMYVRWYRGTDLNSPTAQDS